MVRDPNSENLGSVADIDWPSWQPDDEATLLFIVQGERVLLIHKKRGLGAGKINGPGGRLEPGETPEQASVREVREEVGVLPLRPEGRGVLSFQFTHGYKLRAHLFVAAEYEGTLLETDEAVPFWCAVDELPFDRMWADDALWLPHVLNGRSVEGHFVFEGEKMLDQRLEILPRPSVGSSADAQHLEHAPSEPRATITPSTWTSELPHRLATRKLAARVAPLLRPGDLVVLSGPLGSGKTFFARALCRSLGVETQRITSPTFSLVHEFQGSIPIAHADLYRLDGEAQLSELGLDALREDGSLLLVEWGELYIDALGGDALIVALSLEPRRAKFSAQGRRSNDILQALERG